MGRIREALARPAPRHHESTDPAPRPGGRAASAEFREWLPVVGRSADEQRTLFKRQCELLRAEIFECATVAEAAAHLIGRAHDQSWKRIAYHAGGLLDSLVALCGSSFETLCIANGYDRDALEQCDAGLTECESLVAQTGSVCVTATSSGGRALSVLPPEHVVVAQRRQLVPDLIAAYEQLATRYRGNYPSFISFISGPSRTGDIERILVLGAHGPRRLTIYLIDQ